MQIICGKREEHLQSFKQAAEPMFCALERMSEKSQNSEFPFYIQDGIFPNVSEYHIGLGCVPRKTLFLDGPVCHVVINGCTGKMYIQGPWDFYSINISPWGKLLSNKIEEEAPKIISHVNEWHKEMIIRQNNRKIIPV